MKKDIEYAKIISKNLRRIMADADRKPAQVSRDLKIPKTTISGWLNGNRVPRMKYVDLLCHYFNVSRADIVDDENGYYQKTLRPDAQGELLALFSSLNEQGQSEAISYLRYLAQKEEYKKDEAHAS